MCLDYDGNINDACLIALLAALKNGKKRTLNFQSEVGIEIIFKFTKYIGNYFIPGHILSILNRYRGYCSEFL